MNVEKATPVFTGIWRIAVMAALFVDEMRRQGFDKQYVLPGEYDDLADALDEVGITEEREIEMIQKKSI